MRDWCLYRRRCTARRLAEARTPPTLRSETWEGRSLGVGRSETFASMSESRFREVYIKAWEDPLRYCPCETGRGVSCGIRRQSLLRRVGRERGCRTCQRTTRQRGRNRAGWYGRGRSQGVGGCSGWSSGGSSSGRRVRERRRRRLQLTLADQRAIPVVPIRKSCATSASRWPSMARWRRRWSGCSRRNPAARPSCAARWLRARSKAASSTCTVTRPGGRVGLAWHPSLRSR